MTRLYDPISFFGTGSYVMILHSTSDHHLQIGKLGRFFFPKGYYAYVGSAFGPGGLTRRIDHHLRLSPKPHWHVDYLRKISIPVEAWISEQKDRQEHQWASVLAELEGATVPSPGFGSSDCCCKTHLFHFKKNPSFKFFKQQLNPLFSDLISIKRIKFL